MRPIALITLLAVASLEVEVALCLRLVEHCCGRLMIRSLPLMLLHAVTQISIVSSHKLLVLSGVLAELALHDGYDVFSTLLAEAVIVGAVVFVFRGSLAVI